MLLTEYDAKFHEDCVRKEGIEIGIEKGQMLERIDIVINALNNGMTESEITEKLLIPPETIEVAKEEMVRNKTR